MDSSLQNLLLSGIAATLGLTGVLLAIAKQKYQVLLLVVALAYSTLIYFICELVTVINFVSALPRWVEVFGLGLGWID